MTYLEERALGAPHEKLQLLGQGAHDARLDGDEEVLLRPVVLQDDGERVLDLAVDAPLCAEEACDRLWPTEEREGLVDAMCTWQT